MATKYFANKITTNVGKFDSMAEYRHWLNLEALRKAASNTERVTDIARQVVYRIEVNGQLITKYIADFVVTFADGRVEIHDVKNPYLVTGKGKSTPAAQMYKLKCKLLKAIHNVEVKTI
jgi:hypothetical protein